VIIVSYRNYYKPNVDKTYSLKSELKNLQQELANLQENTYNRPQRRQTNYFEYDQLINNKLLMIGGCILLGIGLAYLFLNPRKKR